MTDAEHTLLIVEEDDLDAPEVYQVAQLDHPPDSPQVAAVEEAMREMVAVAEAETGTPHRFVKESDDPDVIASHYEMHADAEDGELVTDGGLYEKYDVRKDGERVDDCFVLEPADDPAAREALLAYADVTDDDELAGDLREWVDWMADGEEVADA